MKKLILPTSLTLKRASVLTVTLAGRQGEGGGGVKSLFTPT
jgi:hypothetical protein